MDDASTVLLRLERMSYGPDAIAHMPDGKTVFVSGGIQGDLVRARVDSEAKGYCRAEVVELVEPSAQRVKAPCPFAELCGGCPWAFLNRNAQLEAKRSNVIDALVRVGHLERDAAESLVQPCEDPGEAWGYRSKVELTIARKGTRMSVGMHDRSGSQVLRIDRCPLLDTRHQKLVKSVSGALSYLGGTQDLGIERVGIRASSRTRDIEVALWTTTGPFPRAQVAKVLGDACKPSSIVRVMTKGPAKARRVSKVERLQGKGCWEERIGAERMALSAPSFFQVNTRGAERLVQLVCDGLGLDDGDEAMDLYCGAGTFTLPLARTCSYVSAVEASGPAVQDLRRNLERAGIDNVEPIGGDAGREFPDTDADVIVVDPPRAGLDIDVVRKLSAQPARAIAYVSCDPSTLARDLARFAEQGVFAPVSVTPVDLFPQTFHVETVTLLCRQDS